MAKPPDFIIIGASRSGTSSLSDWLHRHPDVHIAGGPAAEIHFFDLQYRKGAAWYFNHFRDGKVSGEKSPFYLPCPFVPVRVAQHCPNTKLIALLREPGARAYSHYRLNVARGEESLPFLQAIKQETSRLSGVPHHHPVWRRYSYLARGRYAEQLQAWKEHGPDTRSHLLPVRSEDLFWDTNLALGSVCQFLDVEPRPGQVLGRNRGQSYPPMGNEWGVSWER
jgi:hypothetical protein